MVLSNTDASVYFAKALLMRRLLYLFALIIGIVTFSCEQDDYYLDNNAKLVFSIDTLTFDTVFTEMGSVTRHFKVFNKYSKDLKINKISLSGGKTSMFRINVDGIAENSVSDLTIGSQDSMYIFVEVTVDPNDSNLPFIVADSIVFETNGNIQDVDLTAYGQNVHHISIEENDSVIYLDKERTIKALYWTDKSLLADRPYLIHDHIYIDTLSTLTIDEGVTLYMAKDVNLYVQGSLDIQGSLDMPVVIRGDRLDELLSGTSYDKVPGQWGYIYLMPGSRNNRISFAEIRNGNIGIQVDSSVVDTSPTLKLSNTKIENMLSVGVYGIASSIEADNCLFANCGIYGVALTAGGDYLFNHCTMSGYLPRYLNRESRLNSYLTVTNYRLNNINAPVIGELKRAEFNNCIVFGDYSEEINISLKEDSGNIEQSYLFNHCLLKVRYNFDTTDVAHFTNNIWNESPKFVSSVDPFNFAIDTLSPAIAKADTLVSKLFELDLNGIDRLSDGFADIGAYEFVPR